MTVTIKSKEQLLGTWVRRIKNNTDITDFQTGGALVTLMEAVAQQVYQAQLSVLKVLEVTEVDNLVGERLDDLAESLKIPNGQGGVGRQAAIQATGTVTIGSEFKKISTRAYAGRPAPYAGSTVLYVQDASEMFAAAPVNGKVYLGRNTVDSFEGPILYTSISSTGTYWIINLADPLTKDHPYTDEIVLAQGGDRTINASTVVQVPASAESPAIQLTVDAAVILPDGEDSVTVSVTCSQFGVTGNVASGAVTEFSAKPFVGATVINKQPFVNGFDTESDASLRQRIKDYPNTLARGTVGAINSALLTVVDADTKKKVVSASVIRPLEKGEPTTVYVDDGSLLEPVFLGQDYELLLAKASGLEQSFRTAQAPVTPAVVAGAQQAPYVLQAGMSITFLIDNIPYVYTIAPSNYKDLTAATAYEIVRDLNSDAEGILDFRVTENGTKIVAIDRTNTAEEIRVIPGELQSVLGFPTVTQRPIYLYKNGILQSFKGKTATISSNPFSNWSITGASYTGLQVIVDGVAVAVADITNTDFLSRFGVAMTAATAENWREVLQAKIPGVTVIFQDNRFIISSNKENNSSSEITISAGGWIGPASIFSTEPEERTSVGASKDYTFNRYTGDIRFISRLQAGDIIEIASVNTRAFVKSTTTSTGLYDLSNDYPGFGQSKFIVALDGDVQVKTTGSITNGLIEVTEIDSSGLTVSLQDYLGNGLFINAEINDYIYLAAVKETETTPISGFSSFSDEAIGFYKIKKIVRGTVPANSDTIVVEVSSYQAAAAFILGDRYDTSYLGAPTFKLFSSTVVPQVVSLVPTAAAIVEEVANQINEQIVGGVAERSSGQYFFLRTNTYTDGQISIIATFGKANNLFTSSAGSALQSHVGSSSSVYLDGGFPVVAETVLPSDPAAGYAARDYLKVAPNYTEVTQTTTNPIAQAASIVSTYPVGFQETWVTGKLSGWTGRVYNTETIAPFEGFLRTDSAIKPIGSVNVTSETLDRYSNISLRLQDLSITPFDKFVVEMDLDSANKTITLPLYKKAIISDEQQIAISGKGQKFQFTLKDPEDFDKEFFDVTSPFRDFDFNDFKVVGKSVGVYKLNSAGMGSNEPALAIRSTSFGGANRVKLNVLYPQSPSKGEITISHSNVYENEEVQTVVVAEMASQAAIPSTIFNSGTYKVTNSSTSNNLTDITLSTFQPSITAVAKFESLSPSFGFSFGARSANYPGVLGNSIELVIQDSGKLGTTAELVQMIAQSTKKVILDLRGSAPTSAQLAAALSVSTYLETVTETVVGSVLSLVKIPNTYGYIPEVSAKISNPYFTISFNQVDYSPRLRGAAGNSWSFKCISTGTGTPIVTINTAQKIIEVNLRGSRLLLTDLENLLNGSSGFNANIIKVEVSSGDQYLAPFGPSFFSGGVTVSNTIYTSDGADETNGVFDGLYLVNNLLQVNGTQSTVSMPIGVWPIVDKPTAAELTIRVPNYVGLSSATAVNTIFNAANYQLQSFPVEAKTLKDLADAINAYLPETPVVTAAILGLETTNALMPGGAQIPRATYINYTNPNALPGTVDSSSSALSFHAFWANRSEGCSIYDYDLLGNAIKSVVQSNDAMFPSGNAILGTAYSSVGEEVYLLPTNAATFSRWANFAPASSLPIQADIVRAEGAAKVQISSKLRGTKGSVYPKDTLANNYKTVTLEAASAENGSVYFPLLVSQTKQLPRGSIVKVKNALVSELLRPFRVASPLANLTPANTANEKTWFRTGTNIVYEQASSTRGRLYFLRHGQSATIGSISVTDTEPLASGTEINITYNTPSVGLATITCSAGTLSARIGDMLYIRSAGFPAEVNCPALDSGLVMNSSLYDNPYGLTGYVGYPVVQVNDSTSCCVIAPNLTQNHTLTLAASTDLVFVPTVYTEKNIKTQHKAGSQGVEVLGNVATQGTHAESISGVCSYGIVKKLSDGFSALILSNTSDGTTPPDRLNDTMLLAECGVNTDDYVFLNGFGQGVDGQYQLVAHDGKNTAILYNSVLPIQDVVQDSVTRSVNVGKNWWGKELQIVDNDSADYTIDPRVVRIVDAESVLPGCKISIASAAEGTSNWFPQALVGIWTVTEIGFYGPSASICPYIEFDMPAGAPAAAQLVTIAAANEENIGFLEKEPFSAFRLVQGWAIDPKNAENAQAYLTPAKSYQKISNYLGSEIECVHKLGYETVPKTGIDGYKIFGGLIREAQRTVDGVPTSISRYPGVKSTGTDVSVLPPIPRSVSVSFRVRARDGISINTIAAVVRSAVVSFIGGLGIGQSVILSELIGLVQDIPGVVSVEIIETLPFAVDGRIPVADNEKAVVIDSASNISVGQ